ncbi:MAG: hypothetical protein ABEJ35_07025 [Halobacteriaceae archaeon]
MSVTQGVEHAIDHAEPAETTPISLHAEALETTAPEYLRDLKFELSQEGYLPAEVVVGVSFDEDCSFAVQSEADRLRDYVRAAAFVGAGTLRVRVDNVAAPGKVAPALEACRERAEREGVRLEVEDAPRLT